MSGVTAPVLDYNDRQRASLNARLVVLCETIAQLRAAVRRITRSMRRAKDE